MAFSPGEQVGPYRIMEQLGGGLIGFESLDAQSVCIGELFITLPSLAPTP